jgi:hypothetical protein
VKKLDVIAQNQNHFRNQGVEIVQKLSILCKHRNQCRPVKSEKKLISYSIPLIDLRQLDRQKCLKFSQILDTDTFVSVANAMSNVVVSLSTEFRKSDGGAFSGFREPQDKLN